VRFFELGPVDSIDAIVAAARAASETPAGGFPSARDEAEWRAAARALHAAVWAPVAGGADGAATFFVVATAALLDVDFGALLAPDGRAVIESHRVHLLSSARDLLRFRSESPPRSDPEETALLVGDPASGGVPDPCAGAPVARPRLSAAAEEVERIAARIERAGAARPDVLVGADATEGEVARRAAGRAVLHFATHGFFCAEAGARGGVAGETLESNPLVQCGLVLAPGPGEEDGLLTAQEIVALDLAGLDCVVLSACETGLGRLAPGEGRLGLRRAFEIAGARTVVMSLGRISDARTRDLVVRLHELRLAGRPTADALRTVELERLAAARRRGRVHPALWAGFVAEGDWR
jgi:CHAT domain-containing protein